MPAGHGHAFQGLRQGWRPLVFPVQFGLFEDGVFITAANAEHKSLLGAKVLKMGEFEMEQILNRALLYIGQDNLVQGRTMGVKLLRMRQFYEWVGVFNKGEGPSLLALHPDGEQGPFSLKTHAIGKDRDIRWSKMNGPAGRPLPLYLRQPDKNYWSHYLKDKKIVWLQYNVARNSHHGQNLEPFAEELFDFIEKQEVEALVIDVRNNLGGNSFLNRSIVNRGHGIPQN